MRIEDFNGLPADAAREVLRPAADVGWWVDGLVAARPYDDRDALLARAERDAARWSTADVDAALAHHPRIGERPAGEGAEAAHSRREQAAIVDPGPRDPGLEEAVAAGNAAYEARFDRVFLIRAAGRTRKEILDELVRRLDNEPAAEAAEVAEQLTQIALLRLDGILS
ncbi:2-oxo-4-hydroxy-4-carboxy-5-ureidoimidazoline decarboxylase [Nocardioides sp. ChNu-153]|uniref:2-oxo-4-hydroxy-4-carboxy-5-ureidoimidazoline decarboxylase n=1 Tax=unclassified Nocardioides TaxID=2615069 RepID=UPI00240707EC|nr:MULTISPECIES: 2-oxo-4-hydroxy-4-carboxy-5-ureidoimidazoline decarboxylase [unclassified Nocardioides]MDF9716813.1 2-oxo-4-hydroxy-4-carboxy-5-ureidoimidazoline decarboxylase [Nocardioides sp. ChNu-99]MDN7120199.1 2-oxo-4-hydroxy-4-carboxy-5-ureidoimidazoline decarboxylase [Nocardioides sp. ChNu-153]